MGERKSKTIAVGMQARNQVEKATFRKNDNPFML